MEVVVFACEDAAITAAQGPRSYPRDDDRAWNIEDVTGLPAAHNGLTASRKQRSGSRISGVHDDCSAEQPAPERGGPAVWVIGQPSAPAHSLAVRIRGWRP